MSYVSLGEMTDSPPEAHQHLPHDTKVKATEGWHYYSSDVDSTLLSEPSEVDDTGTFVELLFPSEFSKLLVGIDAPPPPGDCARLRIYLSAQGPKKAIVDRDSDLLTPEEY